MDVSLTKDGRPLRVLIVEDEQLIALDLALMVEDLGGRVVGTAARGDEAIELADRHRPDLVLMDIRLRGDMDGIDAAAEIRRRFGIRCVFVTASTDAPTRARMHAFGPHQVVPKPAMQSTLREAILRVQET